MKRQFKFRAWCKNSECHPVGIMRDFSFDKIFTNTYGDRFIEIEPPYILQLKDVIVMQYLGEDCKDINGTELCEGDLITNDFNQGRLCQIKYSHGVFYVIELHKFKNNNYLRQSEVWEYCAHNPCRIMGNIYQNPELLTGE